MSAAMIPPAIIVSSIDLHLVASGFKNCWTCRNLAQQQPNRDGGKKDIEQRERDERHDESGHRRDCFSRPHQAVNDPGLSSDFRDYPTGFNCDEAERRAQDKRTQKPFRPKPCFRWPCSRSLTLCPPVSPGS